MSEKSYLLIRTETENLPRWLRKRQLGNSYSYVAAEWESCDEIDKPIRHLIFKDNTKAYQPNYMHRDESYVLQAICVASHEYGASYWKMNKFFKRFRRVRKWLETQKEGTFTFSYYYMGED